MKKAIILHLVLVFIGLSSHAQQETSFGIRGGMNITFFKVDEGDFGEDPEAEFGYYGGVFVDFMIDNGFHFQPELLYKGVGELEFINAPLYLKYDVNNTFHILVGPSMNYFFDLFVNKFKVRGDLALSYDFLDRFDIQMKYTLGFEVLSPNIIFLGVGYRL